MVQIKIEIPEEAIADFCRRHYIKKLSFFGSVLHDSFRPDSDIDILVEFEPGHIPGYGFIRMQYELSEILGGRKVDLVTPKFLNKRIRDRVQSEAVVQYVQG